MPGHHGADTSSNLVDGSSPAEDVCLLLFEHQVAALADHALCRVGKARKKPWQRDFEAHSRLVNVDDAGRALPKRRDAEGQTVAGPNLFIKRQQPREFGLGAADAFLDATQGLVFAKPMRNYNDKRFRHWGSVSRLLSGMWGRGPRTKRAPFAFDQPGSGLSPQRKMHGRVKTRPSHFCDQSHSGMFFVFGSAHSLGCCILLAHIGARFRLAVPLVAGEVVDL